MLERQHRGGHQHSHLLAVRGSLESGTYGHFRLAESHVAAYEAVHRSVALHVMLYVLCGFRLVRRVLIQERRLQLVLQVRVGRE